MGIRTGKPKGRPITKNREMILSNDIKVRLNDSVHDDLLEYCRKHELSKAEVMRIAITEFLKENK